MKKTARQRPPGQKQQKDPNEHAHRGRIQKKKTAKKKRIRALPFTQHRLRLFSNLPQAAPGGERELWMALVEPDRVQVVRKRVEENFAQPSGESERVKQRKEVEHEYGIVLRSTAAIALP